MPESRYLKLYPMHDCQQCGLEHVHIPAIVTTQEAEGETVEHRLVPFEVLAVLDGAVRPGHRGPDLDTPAHISVLLWGPPGAAQPAHQSILWMN